MPSSECVNPSQASSIIVQDENMPRTMKTSPDLAAAFGPSRNRLQTYSFCQWHNQISVIVLGNTGKQHTNVMLTPLQGPSNSSFRYLFNRIIFLLGVKDMLNQLGNLEAGERADQSGSRALWHDNATWAGRLLRQRGLDEVLLKQLMERLELRKALLTDNIPVLDHHLQLVRLTDTAVEKHVMWTLEGSSTVSMKAALYAPLNKHSLPVEVYFSSFLLVTLYSNVSFVNIS